MESLSHIPFSLNDALFFRFYMSVIPPHYSERYINLRYNKALYIVQHLPASSTFQPTKAQKLELYAYYKQVSHGDVDTQRPGIFDVVGRAKWDAWKKLEGMKPVEAKHRYIDILLRAATEVQLFFSCLFAFIRNAQ
ncbi:acyl CoA binding protein-domain-containing protein [Radiomyces spectabilis]|uniref:acyl CoA binding protein-domain-containing protein n=1 Tax=Radiomyces spectabilis TaxID=64574 RepID=UPI00221FFBFE|nr:acyl CoA binding protein-domain-containing protein [Radiomyces spectabilis]KAI8393276.1 acyl CoA binding protein-domain-containing protein [Radiomyces spectabilis]